MPKTETAAKPVSCGCLCGENVNPKSTFRQGHDQRMIGELALRVAEGSLTNLWVERLQLPTEVDGNDIQERINLTSAAVAKFFSDALARKFAVAAQNRWDELVRKSQPKEARQPKAKKAKSVERKYAEAAGLVDRVDMSRAVAIAEDLATKPPQTLAQTEEEYAVVLGAPVKVKVGRWEYDATIHGMSQAGKVTAVRYDSVGGKEIVKTEGQFTIVK